MSSSRALKKKRRRFMLRRKRTLDPSIVIDFKKPDVLKRFITERGKIIPRRISGATSEQQREITVAIKRARYLSLLPTSVSHRPERGFTGEMSAINAGLYTRDTRFGGGSDRPDRGDRPRQHDGGGRDNRDRDDSGSDSEGED
jgi:small subunit ribosomal protein S18